MFFPFYKLKILLTTVDRHQSLVIVQYVELYSYIPHLIYVAIYILI